MRLAHRPECRCRVCWLWAHDARYRVGLSTERGFDVDRVFVAAAAYDLCPHAADLPDAPLTATSGARAR